MEQHKNKEPYLLVWIRVIVESNPTVICNFREIFIIKLLQADVMGWPGNTSQTVYSLHDVKNYIYNLPFPSADPREGNFSEP